MIARFPPNREMRNVAYRAAVQQEPVRLADPTHAGMPGSILGNDPFHSHPPLNPRLPRLDSRVPTAGDMRQEQTLAPLPKLTSYGNSHRLCHTAPNVTRQKLFNSPISRQDTRFQRIGQLWGRDAAPSRPRARTGTLSSYDCRLLCMATPVQHHKKSPLCSTVRIQQLEPVRTGIRAPVKCALALRPHVYKLQSQHADR